MVNAVLINDTRVDFHHGCLRVVSAMERLADLNDISFTATAPAHSDWRKDEAFLTNFERAELVIVNGEGTLHHSRPAGEPLMAAGKLARAGKKRSALINMSWFNNNSEMEKGLKNFDIVAVRESASLDQVRRFRPDCSLVPDLVFCGPKRRSSRRSGLGWGDSVVPAVRSELLRAKRRFGGEFLPIRFMPSGSQPKFAFFRSFLQRRMLIEPSLLRESAELLLKHVFAGTRDTEILLDRLSRLELLVTGRFHGVGLALCAGTPVLAMTSNTPKVESLINDAGLTSSRLLRPGQLNGQRLEAACGWEDGEEARVYAYLDSASERAGKLFRDIRGLI